MSIHEAQTQLLIWLWELGHSIFDREAQERALEQDGPWGLTFKGMEFLDGE